MKTTRRSYEINAPVEKVWQALIDPKIIAKWGAGPAKMDDHVGTKFYLWGGEIFGKNLEVIPNKKLVQEFSDKDVKHPGKVTISLSKENNGTKVSLVHKDIDTQDEMNDFADGWQRYYFGEIKKLLES